MCNPSKLLPPCRGKIHGRQLRNNAKLTQPHACTNRYPSSLIPYYFEFINVKTPIIGLLNCYFPQCLPTSKLGFFSLSVTIVVYWFVFWVIPVFFFFFLVTLYIVIRPSGCDFVHIISYHIISYHRSYHIISYHIISYHIISYHIHSFIWGYSHIKTYRDVAFLWIIFFTKKSLNMGPIFCKNIPKGSVFPKFPKFLGVRLYFKEKYLKMRTFFCQNDP